MKPHLTINLEKWCDLTGPNAVNDVKVTTANNDLTSCIWCYAVTSSCTSCSVTSFCTWCCAVTSLWSVVASFGWFLPKSLNNKVEEMQNPAMDKYAIEPPVVLSPAEPSETDGNFRQTGMGLSRSWKNEEAVQLRCGQNGQNTDFVGFVVTKHPEFTNSTVT